MSQANSSQFIFNRHQFKRVPQRHMNRYQDHSQVVIHQHHSEVLCAAEVCQDFCMSRVVNICQSHGFLVNGSRDHSSDPFLESEINPDADIVVRRFSRSRIQLSERQVFGQVTHG